jgi:hypothetical protein
MTTAPGNAQGVKTAPAVEVAVKPTAQMFSQPRATVAMILEISLRMTSERAGNNPELSRRLYAMSRPSLPATLQEFYDLMAENTTFRQEIMDDFRATFGATLGSTAKPPTRRAQRLAGPTEPSPLHSRR